MQVRLVAAAVVVLGLGVAVSAAHAQSTSFVGQWQWNARESSGMAPNEPVPQSVVLMITAADPKHVAWSLTAIDAKGQTHSQSFDGSGNGVSAPITGSPDGAVGSYTVTPTSVQAVHTSRDGTVERTACAITPDGRKMICHGTENDGKGHTDNFQDVYDRK